MNKNTKPNALLIELVIVLFFFSLSASVILQLFVAAHNKSLSGSSGSVATVLAEDTLEAFAASSGSADAFFTAEGWTATDKGYQREITYGREPAEGDEESASTRRALRMTAEGTSTQTPAGTLDEWTLTVLDDDEIILSIPLTRYLPKGEGTQ